MELLEQYNQSINQTMMINIINKWNYWNSTINLQYVDYTYTDLHESLHSQDNIHCAREHW